MHFLYRDGIEKGAVLLRTLILVGQETFPPVAKSVQTFTIPFITGFSSNYVVVKKTNYDTFHFLNYCRRATISYQNNLAQN